MKGIEGLVDIESSLKADRPTLDVKLNRTLASDLGISLAQVSETLRPLLAGAEAGT